MTEYTQIIEQVFRDCPSIVCQNTRERTELIQMLFDHDVPLGPATREYRFKKNLYTDPEFLTLRRAIPYVTLERGASTTLERGASTLKFMTYEEFLLRIPGGTKYEIDEACLVASLNTLF